MIPPKPKPKENQLKTLLNLLIVISLLAFTLACGLTGDSEGDNKNAAAETTARTDDSGAQDTSQDSDQADDDSASASEEDASQQGEDKSITVKFSKGKTSGTYRDSVSSGNKHVYSFGVAQDQDISVRISSSDNGAYFKVFDPSGEPVRLSGDATRFSESAPESGNYRIEVRTSTKGSEYTVRFAASALPADDEDTATGGSTVTVRFAKGRSSATYSGAVIRGERDIYVLGANGGQQMSVSITSEEDNAVFQIEGPGGYLRGAEPGSDRTSWSGQLPANGKYRVIVGGTRGNATYSVTMSIR
jgi:hypothetical protein